MKRVARGGRDRGSDAFHRRKAVAPLKRVARGGRDRGSDAFHRRKAVAPLKRRDVLLEVDGVDELSIAERRWPH